MGDGSVSGSITTKARRAAPTMMLQTARLPSQFWSESATVSSHFLKFQSEIRFSVDLDMLMQFVRIAQFMVFLAKRPFPARDGRAREPEKGVLQVLVGTLCLEIQSPAGAADWSGPGGLSSVRSDGGCVAGGVSTSACGHRSREFDRPCRLWEFGSPRRAWSG